MNDPKERAAWIKAQEAAADEDPHGYPEPGEPNESTEERMQRFSFADGCSCGDGTIYRACNFVLTDIKRNDALCLLPNGDKIHKMTLHSNPTNPRPELGGRSFYDVTGGKYDWDAYVKAVGGTILPGYQLRYIYFIDPEYRKRLKVPEIPFSRIDELNAGMYKGESITQAERHAASHYEP